MKKKLSIIIPIYNGVGKVEKMLNTLLMQVNGEFEIICLNDGSKDNTKQVLEEFSEKFNQKEKDSFVLINKENSGVSDTRNSGINIAKGEYITFADCDDYYNNDFISDILKSISIKRELIIFNYNTIQNNKYTLALSSIKEKKYHLNNNAGINGYLNLNYTNIFSCTVWNKIYRIDIVKKNNIKFPTSKKVGEDLIFNIEYFNCCHELVYLGKPYYNYAIFSDSAVHRYYDNYINDLMMYFPCLTTIFKNNNYHSKGEISKTIFMPLRKIICNEVRGSNYKSGKDKITNLFNNPDFLDDFYRIEVSKLAIKEKIYYCIIRLRLYNLIYDILFVLKKLFKIEISY